MVELPLLRVGDVAALHDLTDEARRQVPVTRHPASLDAEPRRIFDRPLVGIRHADRERRHVVHEEVGEVLRRHDDQNVGTTRLQAGTHVVERGVEAVAQFGIGAVGAAGDPGSVGADTGEDERHQAPSPRALPVEPPAADRGSASTPSYPVIA